MELLRHKASAHFLLILFIGYYGSITLFPHIHTFQTGRIVHSHPFHPSPDGNPVNHTHSKAELLILQDLSEFTSDLSQVTVSSDPELPVQCLEFALYINNISINDKSGPKSLRAPPAL